MSSAVQSIDLSGQIISYTLRISARSRSLRITIYPDRGLVVSAPPSAARTTIEKFLLQKSSWILKHLDAFASNPTIHYIRTGRDDYRRCKAAALELATRKVAQWNAVYDFAYRAISIRNQSTRWGSCSSNKNLNFNYRIVHLPEGLVDYLVIHELCHLGQMNHSKKFWDLVAVACPDYKNTRKELKAWRVSVIY